MYVSKYYTCEEIDQRLLQGYYDDAVAHGFIGTLREFWAFFLSIADKVEKREGWDLSENNFSDELKAKLDAIEEHANYVTKVSQLENDLDYQTREQVEKYISDLVDGADDALDTLKELAEALNNDPNFATNITNRLTELRTQLEAEVTRAKEKEGELANQIKVVNDNLVNAVNNLNAAIAKVVNDITIQLQAVNARIQKAEDKINALELETTQNLAEAKEYAKDLVDTEAEARRTADEKIKDDIHKIQVDHTNDMADLNNKIVTEASERANADTTLESKINTETSNRQTADQELESKINAEAATRTAQDEVLHQQILKEIADRQTADNGLQQNIEQEAQNRQNADTVLQNNIDNEKETRIAQDAILDHKIEDVKAQVNTEKENLLEKLNEEKEARIAADADLDDRKVDKREGYSLTKNDFTDILKAKLDGIEERANYITKVSELLNDAGYQTEADLNAAIEKIIGEAPEVLDTLEEIAKALGDDPNFATTITKKLAALTEQLNQEIENRTTADTTLQSNIDKEVADRTTADAALKTEVKEYVDDEIAKVLGNNDSLNSKLEKEIQDRKDADAVLQTAINKEETDRKAADTALDTRITTNATRIQELALSIQEAVNTVKNELQAKIDALQVEVNTNKGNIQRNTDRLNDQISKEADDYAELKALINDEASSRTTADTNLKSQLDNLNIDLNTEISRREAGDTILQQNIDKEVSDRTSADTLLDTKFTGLINTESTARANEDEKINTKIAQEVTDRTNADKALNDRIDTLNGSVTDSMAGLSEQVVNNTTSIQTEIDRAKAAEQAIKDSLTTLTENHKDDLVGIAKDIHDEAQTRLLEDTKLQNAIDSEKVAREYEDNALNTKIIQETTDRVSAINQLNNTKVDKVDGKGLSTHDLTDILKAKLDGIEEFANYITKVSELENDSNYQNAEQVDAAIQRVIGSAPGVLDTLQEIAEALGNDPNFATTITEKLTKLKEGLDGEILDRTLADKAMEDKFTILSNTLNSTVSDLRTFVTETRAELLTKAQAQDTLISQNTANIQRNLELIQSMQTSTSTGYLEVKELLNTEVEARKAENIRIEAKVDKNTQDLNTERNERIEADTVLQNNIEAEAAERTAADEALGARIDKEIQDRKDADIALREYVDSVENELDQRLNAEEAVTESLPTTIVTSHKDLVVDANTIGMPYTIADKSETNNTYTDGREETKVLPSATAETAGLHSAADKKKWDSIPSIIDSEIKISIPGVEPQNKYWYSEGTLLESSKWELNEETGVYEQKTTQIPFPLAVSGTPHGENDQDGLMSISDKSKLKLMPGNILTNVSPVYLSDNNFIIKFEYSSYDIATGKWTNKISRTAPIPLVTKDKCGLFPAEEFKRLTSTGDRFLVDLDTVHKNDGTLELKITHKTFDTEGGVYSTHYDPLPLPQATSEKDGVMSAADKKLFDSIPPTIMRSISSVQRFEDHLRLEIQQYSKESDGVYRMAHTLTYIEAADKDGSGVMTIADRVKLDETLPNQIAQEIQDRKDAIDNLQQSSNTALEALEAKHDAFVATKGQANGFASLDGNGLVPASQLPSYVDDVIEVYATYDVSETGKLSNIKLYSDAAHANPITGESGKIYLNVTNGEPSYQFRWTGTQFMDSNTSSLILGEVTGTAYDGAKGNFNRRVVNSLGSNIVSFIDGFTQDANSVKINYRSMSRSYTSQAFENDPANFKSIYAATSTKAGVMSAADKKLFDSIPSPIMTGATCTQTINSVTINLARVSKSAEGVYSTNNDAFNLPVVSRLKLVS